MKSHVKYLWFNTQDRREYINITREVQEALEESGIQEGMILVSAMHITAGIYVNDAESGIIEDIDDMLDRLAPFGPDYHHHRTGEDNGDAHLKSILCHHQVIVHRTGEDNGDAHLKSILCHHQVIVPVTEGDMDLGPWQQIYYAEFDGRRRKRVIIKVLGE